MKLDFSIPVTLSDYKKGDNPLYSYAKLKIFYVGETGDKRLFTKKFSDSVLKSLPYVPVVGYYNYETDDFVGHNQKVQHIYGVVPEITGAEYVKEGGKEYAVCDVILYTGRADDTGEIAQKIVGKSHSLELNPENVKYKINKDQFGKVKNIEFLEGTLVGLSILGDGENPAFKGSEFFKENDELETIFEGLKEKVREFSATIKTRGEVMENNTLNIVEPTQTAENPEVINVIEPDFTENPATEEEPVLSALERYNSFLMQTSDEELFRKVSKKLAERFDSYVVQMFAEEKILVFFDFEEGVYKRITYEVMDEDDIEFGEAVKVKQRFLTDEEIENLQNDGQFTQTDLGTTVTEGEPAVAGNRKDEGENFEENTQTATIEGQSTNEVFNASPLSDSEREELTSLRNEVNGFRRVKKLELIESFRNDLSSEFLDNLTSQVDSYELDGIDIALSKEFTRVSKQFNSKRTNNSPLLYTGEMSNGEDGSIKSLIDKYK